MTVEDDASKTGDGGDAAGMDPGQAAAKERKPGPPRRRSSLAVAAERQRQEDELRAPRIEAARQKSLRQAREAREAGLEALMQLIMGHPGVRALVTRVNGKADFELTAEEEDELFRRDLRRQNRGGRSQPHQRRKR